MDRSSSATRAYCLIMERISQTAIVCLFLLSVVQVNGSPYSKYGRSCQDIGCLSTEVCVMEEDPCSYGSRAGTDGRPQCGRYPTCKKNLNAEISCSTKNCGGGQMCTIDERGQPKCVTSTNAGYDSAGISSVNGHRTQSNNNNNYDSVSTNTNPYANANAPPSIDDPGRNYPVSSGTNLGYPSYPSTNTNAGSSNGNSGSGYPGYPASSGTSSSGTNLGYPPYPSVNRMPMPGQTGVYQQPPPPQAGGYYPGNSASGYPGYPANQQYPGHSNYPYQTRNYNSNAHYPRYRNASMRTSSAYFTNIALVGIALMIVTKYLS